MQIRLGYVAISLTLDITASKTITYTNYQKLNNKDKKIKLDTIIKENFKNLKTILHYNIKNNIHFYRLSHNLIPLATHEEVNFNYITPYKKEYESIGNIIKLYNLRIDTHPDQFCVLNSPNKKVLENTFKILDFHHNIFKAMKINGKAILHVGGSYNDKVKAIKRFITNFKKLNKNIQNIIILENDDKVFTVKDTLYICETIGVPMVLDYHHYKCHNEGENLNEYMPRILATWDNQKLNPKMHFSSPKNKKNSRSHSYYIDSNEFINFLELLKEYDRNIDIMLECKGKDMALFKLIREIKTKTNYVFLDDTTIEIKTNPKRG
ncbi:MAG: UV DNA damage repair endonuclease UvsE [Bacilli bacterium]|nr:UV DNA damage repair endonuclease UvsE [Bacilli bacterium]